MAGAAVVAGGAALVAGGAAGLVAAGAAVVAGGAALAAAVVAAGAGSAGQAGPRVSAGRPAVPRVPPPGPSTPGAPAGPAEPGATPGPGRLAAIPSPARPGSAWCSAAGQARTGSVDRTTVLRRAVLAEVARVQVAAQPVPARARRTPAAGRVPAEVRRPAVPVPPGPGRWWPAACRSGSAPAELVAPGVAVQARVAMAAPRVPGPAVARLVVQAAPEPGRVPPAGRPAPARTCAELPVRSPAPSGWSA